MSVVYRDLDAGLLREPRAGCEMTTVSTPSSLFAHNKFKNAGA